MRLAKFLAHAGVASRRGAEGIVAEGRVTVDGEVVTDPARDVDETSGVALDGRRIAPEPHEVHALNKPAGVVSTARDTHGRPTVVQLVRSPRRLYPVGRLDADTTGLILLTNDGDLADRLTHPRYGVKKVYRARAQRARAGSATGVRRGRAGDPRGAQAPGAAYGRGGRAPCGRARAGGVRSARPARPRARQEPPSHEGGGGATAPAIGAGRRARRASAGRPGEAARPEGGAVTEREAARSPPASALAVRAGGALVPGVGPDRPRSSGRHSCAIRAAITARALNCRMRFLSSQVRRPGHRRTRRVAGSMARWRRILGDERSRLRRLPEPCGWHNPPPCSCARSGAPSQSERTRPTQSCRPRRSLCAR